MFVLFPRISLAIEFPLRVREVREPAVTFGFSSCDAAKLAIETNCQLFDFDDCSTTFLRFLKAQRIAAKVLWGHGFSWSSANS
jgi:hypothetical protein